MRRAWLTCSVSPPEPKALRSANSVSSTSFQQTHRARQHIDTSDSTDRAEQEQSKGLLCKHRPGGQHRSARVPECLYLAGEEPGTSGAMFGKKGMFAVTQSKQTIGI